jgi:hypothetical protein
MKIMKKLNKLQSVLMLLGGLLMATGAILFITHWDPSPYVYILGSALFVSMQFLQRYEGVNITLRRLRNIYVIGGILILFTGILMIFNYQYVYLKWFNYGFYIRNEWVLSLFVGSLLQLYTSYRIPVELDKEAKKR